MKVPEVKEKVMNLLTSGFEGIVKNYPHLVQDVQNRIVKYHSNKENYEGKITDFVNLVEWYDMCLNDPKNEEGYWDQNGKYFGLRMAEVISMFLMARFNGGMV